MSIRLNKALRELNIGLQTAVEFLEKRSDLGEVKAEPSFKLSDAQYAALAGAFQQDKEVRSQAEKLLQKKPKEKKRSEETQAEPLLKSSTQQQYKPLGKIDLDSLNKKPAQKKPATPETHKEPQAKTNAVSQKPATNSEAPQKASTEAKVDNQNKNQNTVGQNKEHKQEKKQEAAKTVVNNTASAPKKVDAAEKPAEAPKTETGIFTTKSEKKILNAPKVNVLGKIDLSTLNQSTRPKKKSKEEKRKEREDKAQQQRGDKKKRERINKVRVDINAASNQPNGGGKQNGGGNAGTSNKNKKKNRNRGGQQKPAEVSDEDVARQVKETLARLTNKQNQNKKGAKYRKEKREAAQEKMNEELREEKKESKTLKLTEFVTVSELATMMNVSVNQVIGTLMSVGIMVSINQRLDAETINLVAEEFDFKTEYVSAEVQEAITEVEDDENDLVPRAPIVTVMGHVDHGKTSLLDYIRKTNVIAGEAGGITQHIGAYNVQLEDGRKITFLDTPGHEAFTAMRARGAQVTDIAIIIIAADDAVMPTTKEAIAHAQAANVPMVFAINKIDKPGANPDRVREELASMNLLVEEWGGKYQCQEISAKKGIGISDLMEKVLLEAEMLDLKANPNRKATGSIIESSLDKGRGYVSTVLVSNGTLRVGDNIIAGTSWGRIKAMFNERNQRIQSAGPAEPAIILGLNGAPTAGDSFHVLETEQEARDIANKRLQLQREQGLRTQKRLTLSDISHRIALGSFKELNIIVKGDTDGSIEALSDSFIKMSTEKIKVDVIYKAVGQISESDVTLADASDAIIVGFQVRPSAAARKLAEQEGVEINTYSVIYDAIDDVKSAMIGMLDKVKKEVITGQVEVREVYKISKVGTVAGCYVTEGKVHRVDRARVIRDGIVVHTADIAALKRYKDDVKEVATNFECGISLVNFNDIQQGDVLETFTEIEVKQTL
ncbi:MAG: translation initiation factor IF-2 [Prevotella sp.]|uniref:translation initiation factor IF-2 n=1 Tax=Leyella stercorea TaxID=363265 RepID=UPI0025EA87B1|nr:translation initiation factor IF-2 [Prevotella sp.]MDD7212359.1 translation initiation factor IF-2 [Leyella stercorea]MCI6489536.1 translation initiation factor IF-2 [Prevotella sp.]MCI6717405.1 translation initiation factor IF-2 [Prevotella sp.]MCI6897331.1 translation initiation factor IF-2 [Prevotella sp.]